MEFLRIGGFGINVLVAVMLLLRIVEVGLLRLKLIQVERALKVKRK